MPPTRLEIQDVGFVLLADKERPRQRNRETVNASERDV